MEAAAAAEAAVALALAASTNQPSALHNERQPLPHPGTTTPPAPCSSPSPARPCAASCGGTSQQLNICPKSRTHSRPLPRQVAASAANLGWHYYRTASAPSRPPPATPRNFHQPTSPCCLPTGLPHNRSRRVAATLRHTAAKAPSAVASSASAAAATAAGPSPTPSPTANCSRSGGRSVGAGRAARLTSPSCLLGPGAVEGEGAERGGDQ